MSIQKSVIKKLTAQEIGSTIEKQHEAAKIEVHRLEGAKGALLQAESSLESVKNVWKKDLDADEEETAAKYGSPEEAQKTLQAVLKAVEQCQGCVRSLADKSDVQRFMKQGEVAAFDKALDACEGMFQREEAKETAILRAVESGAAATEDGPGDPEDVDPRKPKMRVVGTRPESGVAARRKAAKNVEKATESGSPLDDQPSEQPSGGESPEEPVSAVAVETADRAKNA